MCGNQTWILKNSLAKQLSMIERKILRKIYGPIKDRGERRQRYNKEQRRWEAPNIITDFKVATFI